MSIHGKKEGFLRILGSFLILLSLILSFLFKILVINNLLFILLFTMLIVPSFLLSVLLKLEQDIFVKNLKIFLLLLTFMIVVANIIVSIIYSALLVIKFVLFECSDLLLICCWHFSLSLYKNRKIIFLLSGFLSFFVNYILWISLGEMIVMIIFLTPTLILGIFLIIFAELSMRKKGLLNYI